MVSGTWNGGLFGMDAQVSSERSGNFQESDLSNLKGNGDSPLYFSVEGVGELRGTELSFRVHTLIRKSFRTCNHSLKPSI